MTLSDADRLRIREIREAYEAGHAQGRKTGFDAGYKAAMAEVNRLNSTESKEISL